jgi:hypothetical protein
VTTPTSGITWASPLGSASDPIKWAFATAGSNPFGLGTVASAVTNSQQQAAIASGMNEWATVSGVKLQQVLNPSQANIEVGFGKLSGLLGEDLWSYRLPADTYNGSLVLFQDPSISPLKNVNGQLEYNDNCTLTQLAIHEFGLALGLAEGNGSDPHSILNHLMTTANRVPDAADIAAIDSLYGPAASGSGAGTMPSASSGSPAGSISGGSASGSTPVSSGTTWSSWVSSHSFHFG